MQGANFSGNSRIHVGLGVVDVEKSETFYEVLLGVPPSKVRPGYAKFEADSPPVNLSLHQIDRAHAVGRFPEEHFGIQVKSAEDVLEAVGRLRDAGLSPRVEQSTQCCYARQTKLWVEDPDGHPWEVFAVTDTDVTQGKDAATGCCSAGTCG